MPWRTQFTTNNSGFGFNTKYRKTDLSQFTTEWGMCAAIVALWLRGILKDGVSRAPNEFECQILFGKWSITRGTFIRDGHNVTEGRVLAGIGTRRMLDDAGLRVESERQGPASQAMSVVINRPGAYYINTRNHAIGVVTETPTGLPAYYFLDPNFGVRTTFQIRDLSDVHGDVERSIGHLASYSSMWTLLRLTT
jgi:hypothetical protein